MSAPVLQMRGIEKRFGGVRALKGVDFEIAAGEVVALAGENGAGKSTLMKILGGVYQPDAGQVLIDGQPVTINAVADATKLGVSFIHQELNVLENLDVAANVYLGREPVKGGFLQLVDSQKMHTDAAVYLKRLGLEIPTNTQLWRLSIAQQQMVEIAKALSLNARILIMDEPTSSLTLTETDRLLALVHELKAQNVAIIYISHRLNEIEQIADRVVVLRDGANAGSLSKGEITHDRMVKMMVGRDIESFYQHPEGERARGYAQFERLRTLRYPKHEVSFDVGRGEIIGMAGLVGAGRTEVAQTIFGIDGPVHGRIQIGGQELRIRSPQDAIRHGIYLIPEDRRLAGLITDIPIRENVTLPSLERYAQAWLIAKDRERVAATEVCKKLNVKTPSVEQLVINLSGGNQQKVVLAKWLALEPKLLIFDEPTRGVDVGAKAEIYTLMRELAESGVAILMISSDMEEVLHISDRVAVMHEGVLTGILERSECTEENIMRLAVGKRAA
ncbi:MAG TPA: sugar ABC transporter ATP-binding protein [Pyrinomonadaceae bacterium]|nr:sugar ABC transporter ATP-binding protein [Pyrinomonadaceae bacterium]